MITKTDWNAVDRQTYDPVEQAAFEAFLDEYGHTYDTVVDALADWQALR